MGVFLAAAFPSCRSGRGLAERCETVYQRSPADFGTRDPQQSNAQRYEHALKVEKGTAVRQTTDETKTAFLKKTLLPAHDASSSQIANYVKGARDSGFDLRASDVAQFMNARSTLGDKALLAKGHVDGTKHGNAEMLMKALEEQNPKLAREAYFEGREAKDLAKIRAPRNTRLADIEARTSSPQFAVHFKALCDSPPFPATPTKVQFEEMHKKIAAIGGNLEASAVKSHRDLVASGPVNLNNHNSTNYRPTEQKILADLSRPKDQREILNDKTTPDQLKQAFSREHLQEVKFQLDRDPKLAREHALARAQDLEVQEATRGTRVSPAKAQEQTREQSRNGLTLNGRP